MQPRQPNENVEHRRRGFATRRLVAKRKAVGTAILIVAFQLVCKGCMDRGMLTCIHTASSGARLASALANALRGLTP